MFFFNKNGDIITLNRSSLKSVDKFMYLGSSLSSTENNINIWRAKIWTAIDWLLIIGKSDLSDKIKRYFFHAVYKEKARRGLHKKATSYIEQILEATSPKTVAVRPPSSHLKNHPNKTNKICRTQLEK